MQYMRGLFYAFEIFNKSNQLLRMRTKNGVYAHIPGTLPLKLKFAGEATGTRYCKGVALSWLCD